MIMSKPQKNTRISYKKAKIMFIEKCFYQESIRGPILEIGSGRDRFNRELFAKRYKVIATNIYPQNVVDHICSVNCLPFADNKFGGVICEHVLEHVEEPAKAIKEISRVLKPKGLLMLVVPFSWPLHEKPYDLWRFSEEGLRALLMHSFEGVKFETIGQPNRPSLICVTARKPLYRKPEARHPKVSVIMPTYNRAHMISKSIDSVLKQTFTDWELIVVSDGSTDNTPQVIRNYRNPKIVFLKKEQGGPASARNYGLRHARGEYIAYCDDDDIIFPYYLETMVNCLDRHPEVGLVRGNSVSFKGKQGYFKIGFLWAAMHRRDNIRKVGLFDERLFTGSDIEFMLRFSDYYPTQYLKAIVARYVTHKESLTVVNRQHIQNNNDALYSERVRAICKKQRIKKKYFLLLAYFLFERNMYKALLELAQFFQQQHNCPEATYLLGWAYYRLGNLSQAINALKKVLQFKNKSYENNVVSQRILYEFTYAFLSWIYSQILNKSRQAVKYSGRGLKRYPRSHLLKVEAFHAYLDNSNIKKAHNILKKIKDPFMRAYCKGMIWLSQGEFARAKQYLHKASKIEAVLQYRLYSSLAHLYKVTGVSKKAYGYQSKSQRLIESIWGYPLFMKSNFKGIATDELWDIVGRIFLLGRHPDKRIL